MVVPDHPFSLKKPATPAKNAVYFRSFCRLVVHSYIFGDAAR
jgi:hypothetical protein